MIQNQTFIRTSPRWETRLGRNEGASLFTDCTSDGAYKQANNILVMEEGAATLLYPNPAYNKAHILLPKGTEPDAVIKINLFNMQGQAVADLYNGNAGQLRVLNLPETANGLYMLRMQVNGTELHRERLIIHK